jgi:hypothetical protein
VDPSVEFGLRFETQPDEDEVDDAPMEEMAEPEAEDEDHRDAEVVSLDQFRK